MEEKLVSMLTTCAPKLPNTIHSKLFRLVNTIGGSLIGNGLSRFSLDKKILLDNACAQAGLEDFGDDSFQDPLRILLTAIKQEAKLNFIGRACIYNDILRLLGNRLHLVEDRKRFPEIASESIRRPLYCQS